MPAPKDPIKNKEWREKISQSLVKQYDRGVKRGFQKGHKHSEEMKKKMSLAHLGKKATEETKQKMSEAMQGKNFKHGLEGSTEYDSWCHMKQRCLNKQNKAYKNYGGRGITICDEWKNSFITFIKDMGRKPYKNYSIDRVDNNGNYNRENCRWISPKQQSRNTRRNVIYNNEYSIDACKRLGGRESLIIDRLKRGWSIEKAFTQKLR